MCERRTAIVATYYFIRQDDTADTFTIAEMLVDDEEDLIQKAVGGWVREAGKRDPQALLEFLDRFAATMPRTDAPLRRRAPRRDSEDLLHGPSWASLDP